MKIANLALRFLLELYALAAVSYAGYHLVESEPARLVLCIAAPSLFGVLWGLFAAHKAKFPPREPWKAVVGFLFLEIAALCLALTGHGLLAGVLAVLIAGNAVLLRLWNRWS